MMLKYLQHNIRPEILNISIIILLYIIILYIIIYILYINIIILFINCNRKKVGHEETRGSLFYIAIYYYYY